MYQLDLLATEPPPNYRVIYVHCGPTALHLVLLFYADGTEQSFKIPLEALAQFKEKETPNAT